MSRSVRKEKEKEKEVEEEDNEMEDVDGEDDGIVNIDRLQSVGINAGKLQFCFQSEDPKTIGDAYLKIRSNRRRREAKGRWHPHSSRSHDADQKGTRHIQ